MKFKYELALMWLFSLIAVYFGAHEVTRMVHKMDKEIIQLQQQEKLEQCHRVIAGGIYERQK